MRHEAEDITLAIADARNTVERAVRIGRLRHAALRIAVAEDDPAFALQFDQRLRIAEVVAFTVRDWQAQNLTRSADRSKGGIGLLDAHVDVLADELEIAVAQQGARQQPGLTENL